MDSERVSEETVTKAVEALLKWRGSQSERQKAKLFDEEEEFVYLILTLKKVPSNSRVNPHKIPLPHSLISPFSEQCLILDDRPNKARVTKAQVQSKIQSESIPIAKVLKLSKLASDYRAFEAKRKLCDSYDLFFAEKSIVPLLPRLLGKHFFKKRKIPVPLDLKKNNWNEQVQRACSSAMLFVRSGTCTVVRVAKLRMDTHQIVQNVLATIQGAVQVVPKNWANVRSLHLKLLESLALPLYQVLPDVKLRIEGVRVEDHAAQGENKKRKKDGGVRDSAKKKGRIHEVKYMDDGFGEEIEAGAGAVAGAGADQVVDKKRKKGVAGDSSGGKRLKKVAGAKENRGLKKGAKEDLVVEDERFGGVSGDGMVDEKSDKGVASDSGGGVKRLKMKASGATKEKKKKKGLSGGKGVTEGLVVKDEESGVKKKTGDVAVKTNKSLKAKRSKKAA
ncbi:hypothetical protein Fmac_018707 [Flemingia macrophylla]|uniref:Ribosomal protein L1 n=1 Tax=Flemingia macrophylla TaxID=520843 RepID=A0ABD1M5W2_9FABA